MADRVGITWQISDTSGWGIYGWNLTAELQRRGRPGPLLLAPPDPGGMDALARRALAPLAAEQAELDRALRLNPGQVAVMENAVVLHHLGNRLNPSKISDNYRGGVNAGVVFLESVDLPRRAVDHANRYDMVIAGSTWNRDVLAAAGLRKVEVVLQGVDPALYHPVADAKRLFADRFVVFSGGKLEYRKGQDIVLAAFRAFRQRHRDALLVTAWQNKWPASVASVAGSPHVSGPPDMRADGSIAVEDWAVRNGVEADAVVDLGLVSNGHMPAVLRNVDLAVFPNRCEGGTNLVAMECLACGVPCVLSANTGHLDLIDGDSCFALTHQAPVPDDGCAGWGESSVDELVAAMEAAYADPAEARRRGAVGAEKMRGLSWQKQIGILLETVGAA